MRERGMAAVKHSGGAAEQSALRGVPRWVWRRLTRPVFEEVFEPAYHELLADHVVRQAKRRGGLRAFGKAQLWWRIRWIGVQSLRLQSLREGRRGGERKMSASWREVQIAWRGLVRRPVFLIVAVVTLALGVGANAAIFSVVNGVLLKPLPFRSPDELVTLQAWSNQGFPISVSIPNQRDWHERNTTLEAIAMSSSGTRMIRQTADGAEIIEPEIILGGFFELLGVEPLLGRWIGADETGRGAVPRAVLGYGFWQSAFGGRPDVVGESIVLNGSPVEIVGVMPAGFGMPSPEIPLYVPMGMFDGLPWEDRISSFGARAIARLRAGVTVAAVQRDMDRVTQQIDAEEGRSGARVEVRTLSAHFAGDAAGPLLVLMGAVAFVLLIAGVNVANLLLVRGEGRRREMAMRLALGAGRAGVAKHLLAESLLICLLGAVLGLTLAFVAVAALRARLPLEPIVTQQIGVDGTVLAFSLLLGVACALLFGLVPALRVGNAPVNELREDSRGGEGRGSQRMRSVLVTAELALALVLLVGAGLMIRSLQQLSRVETGYSSERVLTARVSMPRGSVSDRERWIGAYEELIDRVSSEPQASDVAATLLVPLAPRSWELSVVPEGTPYSRTEGQSVLYNIVSLDYFSAFRIPLLNGRWFEPTDRNGTLPVVIVDETLAARMWPNEDPIGKRIAFDEAAGTTDENPIPVFRTVVGVVPNIRHYEVRTPSRIQVYVPLRQTLERWGTGLSLAVRTTGEAAAFAPRLRAAARAVNPEIALTDVRTLEDYVAGDLGRDRALGGLLSAFGGLAGGLAAIGVFGVMSMLVMTQKRDMGVRLALGASPSELLSIVLMRTLTLATVGVVIGLIAAATLSRLLSAFLFDVTPLDAGIYAAAAMLLLAVAFTAALIPALRAARVDPMTVLRQGA